MKKEDAKVGMIVKSTKNDKTVYEIIKMDEDTCNLRTTCNLQLTYSAVDYCILYPKAEM